MYCMRTQRLIVECNCPQCADFVENEILHVDFCDLTHWYCGLDEAGDDTPDTCLIYRGIYHYNRIYVEFDEQKSGLCAENVLKQYIDLKNDGFNLHKDWKVLDVYLEQIV